MTLYLVPNVCSNALATRRNAISISIVCLDARVRQWAACFSRCVSKAPESALCDRVAGAAAVPGHAHALGAAAASRGRAEHRQPEPVHRAPPGTRRRLCGRGWPASRRRSPRWCRPSVPVNATRATVGGVPHGTPCDRGPQRRRLHAGQAEAQKERWKGSGITTPARPTRGCGGTPWSKGSTCSWAAAVRSRPRLYQQKSVCAARTVPFRSKIALVDHAFVADDTPEQLSAPAYLGQTRVGGIDLNKPPRMRAVLTAVLALAPAPTGFT